MKKTLGILALLIVVCVVTALLNPSVLKPYNVENVLKRTSLFGILSLGVAFVIITGGIDLSIGSVVGLVGCLLAWLLTEQGFSIPLALAIVLGVSLGIGLVHGLLVTRLRLQPFVVTLCGLLIYRGLSRWFTGDQTQGFESAYEGFRQLAIGKIPLAGGYRLPVPCVVLLGLAVGAAVVLNQTVYGRYLLALGRNEQAARFSGINTGRMTLSAYVLCSLLAGIAGVLFALDLNSVQPSGHGNFYELYAISAAVLGGCSLRGGEGSILGVVIGAAVMQVLYNSINVLGIPTQLEFAIIGGVLLVGVSVDEVMKGYLARRRGRGAA